MDKEHICPICRVEPTSHSFSKIREIDGAAVFYTAPAKATNLETEGIIKHYELVLENNKQPWIWIFDYKDFPLSQALDMTTGIELAKLITKNYSSNLKRIVIINANIFIKSIIQIISFFLTNEVIEKIHISEETYNL